MTQVIMATNKIESLDPALIRPGRIDRKIEFPLPDIKTKRRIFGIHTVSSSRKMSRRIAGASSYSGERRGTLCNAGQLFLSCLWRQRELD